MTSRRNNFWQRTELNETDSTRCLETVQARYKGYDVEEFRFQGYCSFTLLLLPRGLSMNNADHDEICSSHVLCVERQLIVQLRPARHALDVDIALAARRQYEALVPAVQLVDVRLPRDLQAYEMNKVGGVPLSRLLPKSTSSVGDDIRQKQETLIMTFAKIIARSWPESAHRKRRDSVLRLDTPVNDNKSFLSSCTGKVGSRIFQKLEKLALELPDESLRNRAEITLEKLRGVIDYPVVLNHGDLIPSNILVDEETWDITGLVDWAEAEFLPFGTCLYGLEHLIGTAEVPSDGVGGATFVYYKSASQLRELFWTTLVGFVPELYGREEEVKVMRDIGVFLWHGYAWDDGAINRVVDELNDGEELAKLRAFLGVSQ